MQKPASRGNIWHVWPVSLPPTASPATASPALLPGDRERNRRSPPSPHCLSTSFDLILLQSTILSLLPPTDAHPPNWLGCRVERTPPKLRPNGNLDGKAFEKTAVCLFVYYRVFAPVFDCKSLLGKIIILCALEAAARGSSNLHSTSKQLRERGLKTACFS